MLMEVVLMDRGYLEKVGVAMAGAKGGRNNSKTRRVRRPEKVACKRSNSNKA